jgi:hypothetical protein
LPEFRKEAISPLLLLAGSSLPFTEEIAANTERRYDKILDDLLEAARRQPGERVVTADAKSFTEKRAALQQEKTAQGMGAGLFRALGGAAGKLIENPLLGAGILGAGVLAAPTLDALGEKVKDRLIPSNMQDRMLDEGASSFAKAVGKSTGDATVGLLGDLVSKTVSGISGIPRAMARENMFEQLQQEDDVLAQADPQSLQEAYHTMVRFAPTLATDKNAVRSFLREAVLYGAGPNVITIKQLADAERATTGER